MNKYDSESRNGQARHTDFASNDEDNETGERGRHTERAINDKKVSLTKNMGFKKRQTEVKFEPARELDEKKYTTSPEKAPAPTVNETQQESIVEAPKIVLSNALIEEKPVPKKSQVNKKLEELKAKLE